LFQEVCCKKKEREPVSKDEDERR